MERVGCIVVREGSADARERYRAAATRTRTNLQIPQVLTHHRIFYLFVLVEGEIGERYDACFRDDVPL